MRNTDTSTGFDTKINVGTYIGKFLKTKICMDYALLLKIKS